MKKAYIKFIDGSDMILENIEKVEVIWFEGYQFLAITYTGDPSAKLFVMSRIQHFDC